MLVEELKACNCFSSFDLLVGFTYVEVLRVAVDKSGNEVAAGAASAGFKYRIQFNYL